MKILISANTYWNIYNFRINLVKNLLRNNEVYIIGRKDFTSQKLKKLGCKLVSIDINPHSKSLFGELKLLLNYLQLIKKIKPDFYLGFTIKPNIYGSIVCNYLNIKSICNITGLGESFIKKGLLKFLVTFLYKFSIKKSDLVFFQNKSDLNYFKKLNLLRKNNYALIPGSGINISNFPNYKKKKKKNFFKFLYVGRIIKEKGVIELINAFKKISSKDKKIKLILVGSIRENFKKKFFKNLDSNIKHYNFTKKIFKYYKNADCFVMPSYREGLSRAILEASCLKLPILASNVPGCRELVKNNFNGYLFNVNQQQSIRNALKKILFLKNKKLLAMGERSRLIVKKSYTEKEVINIYLTNIHRLDNEKKI
jgi:glycosyltransferase involved in cell wall biosynthesis